MVNAKIRLIIFFAVKDGEALYSQQKQGWELIDRVPEELWTEVCNIVEEAVIKNIPKKSKKVEWLSEEASQIVSKRR